MSFSFVDSGSGKTVDDGATDFTMDWPASQPGDIIIVAGFNDGGGNVTPLFNWKVDGDTFGTLGFTAYNSVEIKTADGTEPSGTVTVSSFFGGSVCGAMMVAVYRGVVDEYNDGSPLGGNDQHHSGQNLGAPDFNDFHAGSTALPHTLSLGAHTPSPSVPFGGATLTLYTGLIQTYWDDSVFHTNSMTPTGFTIREEQSPRRTPIFPTRKETQRFFLGDHLETTPAPSTEAAASYVVDANTTPAAGVGITLNREILVAEPLVIIPSQSNHVDVHPRRVKPWVPPYRLGRSIYDGRSR